MDANQNPPSERDFTVQEMEEFFASQDAVTGLFSGEVASNSYPPMDNPPITLESLIKMNDDFRKAFPIPVEYQNGADMSRATFDELGKSIKLVKPQGEAWLGMNVDSFIGVEIHIVESVPFGCVDECHCQKNKQINFQLLNPLPRKFPSYVDLDYEIPFEEARKRWPLIPLPPLEK
jgi:hypothetical protein